MPEGKIKEIQGHKLQMKPSWLHESLKSEEVDFPRWRHKYIRSQTSFHAAVNQEDDNFKPSYIGEDLMDLLNFFFNLHQIMYSFGK